MWSLKGIRDFRRWVSWLVGLDAMDRGECCLQWRKEIAAHSGKGRCAVKDKHKHFHFMNSYRAKRSEEKEKNIEGDEVRMWENESSFKKLNIVKLSTKQEFSGSGSGRKGESLREILWLCKWWEKALESWSNSEFTEWSSGLLFPIYRTIFPLNFYILCMNSRCMSMFSAI